MVSCDARTLKILVTPHFLKRAQYGLVNLFAFSVENSCLCHPAHCSSSSGKHACSQIVRMLNGVDFGEKEHQGGSQGAGQVDLCPASLEEGIDNINDFIYNKVDTHNASDGPDVH